jgi:AraC-like DNA-binding protein
MDVLTDLLERSRARGAAFSHTTARGGWGMRFPAAAGLAVHAVVAGEAYLWTGDGARAERDALRLLPGDLVLVRGELAHRLAHAPGAACAPLGELIAAAASAGGSSLRLTAGAGDGPRTVFFCGAYLFEGDLCDGLLRALPDVLPLRPAAGSALRAVVELLAAEVLREGPGGQVALDRLLDVALVHVLRDHFAAPEALAPSWFSASDDPAIGPALRALHADPGRRWTVAALAAEAHLSRAAFARRFAELLGVAPLAYLTEWRMALARERLRDGEDRLAVLAKALGYASEFSFAAAFKRQHGVAPGRWRAQARTRHDVHAAAGVS